MAFQFIEDLVGVDGNCFKSGHAVTTLEKWNSRPVFRTTVTKDLPNHGKTLKAEQKCQMVTGVKATNNFNAGSHQTLRSKNWREGADMALLCAQLCDENANCKTWQLDGDGDRFLWVWKEWMWTCRMSPTPLVPTTLKKADWAWVGTKCNKQKKLTALTPFYRYSGDRIALHMGADLNSCQDECDKLPAKCHKWSLTESNCELFGAKAQKDWDAHSFAIV